MGQSRFAWMTFVMALLLKAGPPQADTIVRGPAALLKAYPQFLDRIEEGALVWRDGTRMPLDDGKGAKSLNEMLAGPDIKDMFAMPYPAGREARAPARDFDPGRVRYQPLFDKMYGDCRRGSVTGSLVPVVWLPTKVGARIMFSSVNGAASQLAKVSVELDNLPPGLLAFLHPHAGAYNCRPIAGTTRTSAHGHGIAIDISIRHAHYWRWAQPGMDGPSRWRNGIPMEIVRIFERHGFIWGGRWYHYDTMHFEYRPELIERLR